MATPAPPYYGIDNEGEIIDTSNSIAVKELQKDLLKLGYWINRSSSDDVQRMMTAKMSMDANSVYSENTTKAVKNLQSDYDLSRKDGMVDFKTGEIIKQRIKANGLESDSSNLGGRENKFLHVKRKQGIPFDWPGGEVNFYQLPPSSFYGLKDWSTGEDEQKYAGTPDEFEIVSHWGRERLISVVRSIAYRWKDKGSLYIAQMSLKTGGSPSGDGDPNHLFGASVDISSPLYCDISNPNFDRYKALELSVLSFDLGASFLGFNCNFVYQMLAGDPRYQNRVAVSDSHHTSFHLEVWEQGGQTSPWPLQLDKVCEGCHPDRYKICVHFRGRVDKTASVVEGADVEETALSNNISKTDLLLANPHIQYKMIEGKEVFPKSGKIVIPSDLSYFRSLIKKGDKGKIVEELQIRLTGFGGCIPDADFGNATRKCVIQFQKDVMERTGDDADGIVDLETMEAIDKLGKTYPIDFTDLECPSCTCSGFGQSRYKNKTFDTAKIKTFQKDKLGCSDSTASGKVKTKIIHNGVEKTTREWMCQIDKEKYPQDYQKDMASTVNEAYHHYEYPGIHRSLLWAVRGIMFYLMKNVAQEPLSVGKIHSGYRCWENNRRKNRSSTNHMGKAIDLHINENGSRPKNDDDKKATCDKVRKLVVDKMKGQIRWGKNNRLSMEPSTAIYAKEFLAKKWVHLDVRTFNRSAFLKDSFFCSNPDDLDGKPLRELKGLPS